MKKATIILLSMLLVLAIGQSVSAKANVNLAVGYSGFSDFEGFSIDISGGYAFNNWLSLEGDILFAYGQDEESNFNLKIFALDADVLVKFTLYKYGYLTFGLEAGFKNAFAKYDYVASELVEDILVPKLKESSKNSFGIGPGFFFNLYFAPKTNLYLNAFFPLLLVETENGKTDFDFGVDFDYKLGVKYEINSSFDVGIEIFGMNGAKHILGAGAKVGYKF